MIRYIRISVIVLLALLTAIPVSSVAQSDTGHWEKQLPSPSLNFYRDMQVVDRETIFGVGARRSAAFNTRGNLVRSYDGGQQWRSYDTHTRGLRAVHFQDRNVGWVGTEYGRILYTENGGKTWQVQYRDTLADDNIVRDITRVNETAWALKGELLLRTTDDGASWSERSIETITTDTSHHLREIQFVNPSHGYMIGIVSEENVEDSEPFRKASFYTTSDSGKTWSMQVSPGGVSFTQSMQFLTEQHGVMLGRYKVVTTSDGGDSWTTRLEERLLIDIHFASPERGWVLGNEGTVFRTTDGGTSWQEFQIEDSERGPRFTTIAFADSTRGWVMGIRGAIYHTTDGGETWHEQSMVWTNTFFSVDFSDRLNGWVGGQNGIILHTTDGGGSWHEHYTPVTERITGVQFISEKTGWVSTANGYVIHTRDSGNTWTIQDTRDFGRITDIFFNDNNVGWIVGRLDGVRYGNGAIGVNSYGGDNWSVRSVELSTSLEDIQFLDNDVGWAVGSNGAILHTIDGGYRWNHQLFDTSQGWTYETLRGVDFVDRSKGWVVGGGTILHTGSGGSIWNKQNPDTAEGPLYQVDFVNADTGWVVGPREYVLHTRDGGQTWRKDSLKTHQYLTDLDFVSAREGWAVGDDGRVYHYEDNTQNSFASGRSQNPKEIRLQQNYPNPFNPSTRIRFSLPAATTVKLTVYNTLGQKVRTLVNQKMRAGTHTARFNGANLSSGVYIYRLETEMISRSRKLLLVK